MMNINPIHQITDITNRFIYLVIVKKNITSVCQRMYTRKSIRWIMIENILLVVKTFLSEYSINEIAGTRILKFKFYWNYIILYYIIKDRCRKILETEVIRNYIKNIETEKYRIIYCNKLFIV